MKVLRLLVIQLVCCISLIAPAQAFSADNCAGPAQALQHEFDSGAGWSLCWHVDAQLGLVLSELAYTAPAAPTRQVLEQIHSAAVLMHYDDAATAVDVVTESGLGAAQAIRLDAQHCAGEILVDTEGAALVCKREYYQNTLTRYANADILPRSALLLSAQAQFGSLVWGIEYELTEDGVIAPATVLSGRIDQFTADQASGTALDGSGQFATSASLVSAWRMDINIDGTPDNDIVDEIQFNPDQSAGVRRHISVQQLDTESRRQVKPTHFRGWRLRDADVSAATDGGNITRIGYYLDPQNAGYRYSSNRFNWAQYQFFISENKDCERTALNNRLLHPHCGDSLDDFIADAAPLSARDPTVWYVQSARFSASSSDWPVINARRSGFRLMPFDWTENSPFSSNLPVIQ